MFRRFWISSAAVIQTLASTLFGGGQRDELAALEELRSSRKRPRAGGGPGSRRAKREKNYSTSTWAEQLQRIAAGRAAGDRDVPEEVSFQRRFRLSYDQFLELIRMLRAKGRGSVSLRCLHR